jgi:hypothetical protein
VSTETTAQAAMLKAAMSVARDLAEGRLSAAELDAAAAGECRELFGTVAGPADALWPVHLDVARQVLALGGVSADELSEWLAVARHREGDDAPDDVAASQPLQAITGTGYRTSPVSPGHGSHSLGYGDAMAAIDTEAAAVDAV